MCRAFSPARLSIDACLGLRPSLACDRTYGPDFPRDFFSIRTFPYYFPGVTAVTLMSQ